MLLCLLRFSFFITVSHLFSALVSSFVSYFPTLGSVLCFVFLKACLIRFLASLCYNLGLSLVFLSLPRIPYHYLSICRSSFVFTFPPLTSSSLFDLSPYFVFFSPHITLHIAPYHVIPPSTPKHSTTLLDTHINIFIPRVLGWFIRLRL